MVSPRKISSPLSLIPEESLQMPSSTKSSESLYSNNTSGSRGSAAAVYNKTPRVCGGRNHKQASFIPITSEVGQRVQSARRLRMKTFQNQLADAEQTITDLAHENRLLRTVHKRQDTALAKYESTNAELPQLLHSHAEEVRVWQTKFRSVQANNKELEQKLKQKDAVILTLNDQIKYYSQLNKDKSLEDRQRLTDKLLGAQKHLIDKDNELKLLTRKTQIEIKSLKKQIQNEQRKSKDLMVKLEKNRLELSEYRKLDELSLNDKFLGMGLRRKDEEPLEKLEKELGLPTIESDYSLNNPSEEPMDFILSNPTRKTAKVEFAPQTKIIGEPTPKTAPTAITSALSTKAQKQPQRRIDRGDGDAAILLTGVKNSNKPKILNQNKKPNQPNEQNEPKEPPPSGQVQCNGDATDTSETNGDVTPQEEDVANDTDEKKGNVMKLPDDVDEESNNTDDDVGEDPNKISVPSKIHSARTQKDISNIRKQITDDFKEREAFLDSFCRQATNNSLPEKLPKQNIVDKNRIIPSNRKNQLLAALKSIDENKTVEKK